MQVNKEIINDIHLFEIEGEVGLYTVTELKELINSCIDEGNIKIILDFLRLLVFLGTLVGD